MAREKTESSALSPLQWVKWADEGFVAVGRAVGGMGRKVEMAGIGAISSLGRIGRPRRKALGHEEEPERKPPEVEPEPPEPQAAEPADGAAADEAGPAREGFWRRLLPGKLAGLLRAGPGKKRRKDGAQKGKEKREKARDDGETKKPKKRRGLKLGKKDRREAGGAAPAKAEKKALDAETVEAELQRLYAKVKAMIERTGDLDETGKLGLQVAMEELLIGAESARRAAKKQLVEIGAPAEPFLLAALAAPDPERLELALDVLWELDGEKIVPALDDLAASPYSDIRLAALRAAQRLKDDAARPFLTAAAHDSSAEVRRRVISYLSWRGKVGWALAELRGLCNDAEATVKLAAVEALAASAPAEALELLDRPGGLRDPAQRRRLEALLKRQGAADEAERKRPARPAKDEEEEAEEVADVEEEKADDDEDESPVPDAIAALAALAAEPPKDEEPDDEPEEKAADPGALAALAAAAAAGVSESDDGDDEKADDEKADDDEDPAEGNALAALAAIVANGPADDEDEDDASDEDGGEKRKKK